MLFRIMLQICRFDSTSRRRSAVVLRTSGRLMDGERPGSDFLAGGGEMGALMRAFDWNNSSLGPPEKWPQSLRVTVRLLLNTGHPMFIWWGPELIQFYNDAYRRTMGPERHPSALGQRGRECWAEIWDIIGPQIDHVMSGKGSTWNEDRLVPVTRNGRREDVWWTYSYGPIDVEGGVGGVLVVCNDVTAQHLSNEALLDQSRFLRQLFELAPGFMAVLSGPDHVFELTNAAYRKLLGDRDIIGKPLREVLPEIEGQGYFELLDEVYRTGKAHVGRRMPMALHVEAGMPPKQLFLDFVYAPILKANREISGVFVEGIDITDHMRAEEHLRLINDELQHRVKNTLTVVSAIASQTLRGTSNDDALKKFQDRLAAFATAHDSLTTANWAAGGVHNIVQGALAPHRTREGRFSVSGPDIILGAKQALSLALALHELATNAIKYGALSNDRGRVQITWHEREGAGTSTFHLQWQEADGPAVVEPSSMGFGSQLIKRVLAADFGPDVEVLYQASGLICRLSAPMANIRAPKPLVDL
jgi:two-component sensor histidine kinase